MDQLPDTTHELRLILVRTVTNIAALNEFADTVRAKLHAIAIKEMRERAAAERSKSEVRS